MPHFDINYIISKQGMESYDSIPYLIISKTLNVAHKILKVIEVVH